MGAKLKFLAAVLLLFAVCSCGRSPMERLIAASRGLKTRPTEARLCEFAYAPRPPVVRGAVSELQLPISVDAAAADVLSDRTVNDSENRRARAAAHFVRGEPEKAAGELEALVKDDRDDARAWSDLAAARYSVARKRNDPHGFVTALAAADRALMVNHSLEEAVFNRALALSALHLDVIAEKTFGQFQTMTTSADWSAEAAERARRVAHTTVRQSWQATIPSLQAAVRTHDDAQIAHITDEYRQECRTWGEAEFLGLWAEAEKTGDIATAQLQLDVSRQVGNALCTKGDALLRDAVAAIDHATPPHRRELIEAHSIYREGRLLYSKHQFADASPLLTHAAALFRRGESPMALAAEYYEGHLLMDQSHFDAAEAAAQSLEKRTPPEYQALRAGVNWLFATLNARDGRLWEAMTRYEAARAAYATLHEFENENFMRTAIASTMIYLGQDAAMWRLATQTWETAAKLGDYRTLQISVLTAADQEISRSRFETARSLLNVAFELSQFAHNPRSDATAVVWRALTGIRLDRRQSAEEIAAARIAVAGLPDIDLREDSLNDLRVALAVTGRDAVLSESLLTEAIKHVVTRNQTLRLPYFYSARAKARRRRGNIAGAIDDLRAATAIAERTRQSIAGELIRDSYFGSADEIYAELVDLLQSTGRNSEAFSVADAARGRTIVDRQTSHGQTEEAIAPAEMPLSIPRSAVVVEYVSLPDRLLRFTVEDSVVRADAIALPSDQLKEMIHDVVKKIHDGDDVAARKDLERLYTLLVADLKGEFSPDRRLVIVPDTVLSALPFSALFDGRSRSYLIEQTEIVIAPSVAAFARMAREDHVRPNAPSVLIVADPVIDDHTFPELPRLSFAEDEAKQIRSLFGEVHLLTGADATVSAVLKQLPSFDVVDFATHALVNDRDSAQSCLVLAPEEGRTGALYLREVASLHLARTHLVTLAGCSTAVTAEQGFGDVRSLAAAFLQAGVGSVVASLWDTDDRHTREFSVGLHINLRRGETAASAVRNIQIAMIRSQDAGTGTLDSWASMQLFGTGN